MSLQTIFILSKTIILIFIFYVIYRTFMQYAIKLYFILKLIKAKSISEPRYRSEYNFLKEKPGYSSRWHRSGDGSSRLKILCWMVNSHSHSLCIKFDFINISYSRWSRTPPGFNRIILNLNIPFNFLLWQKRFSTPLPT